MPDLANPQVGDLIELSHGVSFNVVRVTEHFIAVNLMGRTKVLDLCEAVHEAGLEIVLYIVAHNFAGNSELILKR